MPFRELDTVDFFVDQRQVKSSPISGLSFVDDHDGVLFDCPVENWDANERAMNATISSQDSGDSNSKRRSRRPPLIRKPKTRFQVPNNSLIEAQEPNRSSQTKFSSAFNQYLNDFGDENRYIPSESNVRSLGLIKRIGSDDDNCSTDAASFQSYLTTKSAPEISDLVISKVCRTCKLFFPTNESLQRHSCTDPPITLHYPKLATMKDCTQCGAERRVGYFCSSCGAPLSSNRTTDSRPASASCSPTRPLPPKPKHRSASVTPCSGARNFVPPPSNDLSKKKSSNDLVSCPHCFRKFSRSAADRHIDICCNVVNKPSPIRRRPISAPASVWAKPRLP